MAEIVVAEAMGRGGVAEPVALKLLLPHLCEDEAHVGSFMDEARLTSTLSHPNLVRALEFGEHGGRPFLALEFVPGVDVGVLAQRMAALPWEVAAQIVAAAGDGLHHAHDRGVVHRDVSPGNVLVTPAGAVKVIDFGVAYCAARPGDAATTGTVKGVVAYCSPEQLRGGAIDRRADVFALGVMLHELVTGKRLFRRASVAETMLAVLEAPTPAPTALSPELPQALDDITLRALARDAGERFQTAAELRTALLHVLPTRPRALSEVMAELFDDAH